ncbi:tetratricopeptide repeat protein [Rhizobacter sp. Root404]|uniref:tetratricopeptide repeat protein n=1 Tax=Rhizobacter sp. Root404 TaxID=1736528 RepID=UPI001F301982|nr:tetratricopeptide repeat protein [Rhizobacter sp. Root404]
MRTRQQMYWLFILFAFPLLGSLVYFFAVYLPNSRVERSAIKAVNVAIRTIDPTRSVRDARTAFEDTPTAQNQMRLAAAMLEAGDPQGAAQQYESCLNGPFALDPDIRFEAAKAFVECGKFSDALRYLEALRSERPQFREEAVCLLMARCYAGNSRNAEAKALLDKVIAKFGTFESKAELAILMYEAGDRGTAETLYAELVRISSRWNPLARDLNRDVYRRLMAVRSQR